jgi:hypothetical protein
MSKFNVEVVKTEKSIAMVQVEAAHQNEAYSKAVKMISEKHQHKPSEIDNCKFIQSSISFAPDAIYHCDNANIAECGVCPVKQYCSYAVK